MLISPFFVHIHNIEVQYTTMKNLKENLTASEAVIHESMLRKFNRFILEEADNRLLCIPQSLTLITFL